jgi:hypothetical protein
LRNRLHEPNEKGVASQDNPPILHQPSKGQPQGKDQDVANMVFTNSNNHSSFGQANQTNNPSIEFLGTKMTLLGKASRDLDLTHFQVRLFLHVADEYLTEPGRKLYRGAQGLANELGMKCRESVEDGLEQLAARGYLKCIYRGIGKGHASEYELGNGEPVKVMKKPKHRELFRCETHGKTMNLANIIRHHSKPGCVVKPENENCHSHDANREPPFSITENENRHSLLRKKVAQIENRHSHFTKEKCANREPPFSPKESLYIEITVIDSNKQQWREPAFEEHEQLWASNHPHQESDPSALKDSDSPTLKKSDPFHIKEHMEVALDSTSHIESETSDIGDSTTPPVSTPFFREWEPTDEEMAEFKRLYDAPLPPPPPPPPEPCDPDPELEEFRKIAAMSKSESREYFRQHSPSPEISRKTDWRQELIDEGYSDEDIAVYEEYRRLASDAPDHEKSIQEEEADDIAPATPTSYEIHDRWLAGEIDDETFRRLRTEGRD